MNGFWPHTLIAWKRGVDYIHHWITILITLYPISWSHSMQRVQACPRERLLTLDIMQLAPTEVLACSILHFIAVITALLQFLVFKYFHGNGGTIKNICWINFVTKNGTVLCHHHLLYVTITLIVCHHHLYYVSLLPLACVTITLVVCHRWCTSQVTG